MSKMVSMMNLKSIESERTYRSLPKGEVIGCGFIRHRPGEIYQSQFSNPGFYSAVFLLEGNGRWLSPDGSSEEISTGDVIHRHPGIPHETQAGDTWLEFFLHLPRIYYDGLVLASLLDSETSRWPGSVPVDFLGRALELQSELRQSRGPDLLGMVLKLQECLLQTHQRYQQRDAPTQQDDRLQRAAHRLSHHLEIPLALEDVAKELNLGYESFRKIFRQRFGQSPKSFRNTARLDLAREKLTTSDASIESVALEIGYQDAFAFSKQFRLKVGICPRQYRQQFR